MTSRNEVIIPTARAFELLDNCLDMLETAERDRDQERAAERERDDLRKEVERLRAELATDRAATAHLFRSLGLSLMAQAVENGEHLKMYRKEDK